MMACFHYFHWLVYFFAICNGRYRILVALRLVGTNFWFYRLFELVGKAHLGSDHAIPGTMGPYDDIKFQHICYFTRKHKMAYSFQLRFFFADNKLSFL